MLSKRGTLSNLRRSPLGTETYDSLLERDYMIELEHDPAVREWTKKHSIVIPYTFGWLRRYLPDFLVTYKDGSKELHETKGVPLLFWISTKLKRQSAEKYCEALGWKYKLVTRGLRW
ncbi:MAG: TnsA endonuclease N-terminal domain-containing protein [Planctomycetota bacterium]